MSINLANVDLTGVAVGYSQTISLGSVIPYWANTAPGNTQNTPGALQWYNESGCGLQIALSGSSRQFTLPAGAWRTVPLQPNDASYTLSVVYVLPNAPASLLLATFYEPGEDVPHVGVLGNSPIGLSGQVAATTTQIVNDGNATGTNVVEATPTGMATSAVKIFNDGRVILDIGTQLTAFPLQLQSEAVNTFDDMLDWKRNDASPQEWTWGIDNTGKVYLFNRNQSKFVFKINPAGGFGEMSGQATAGSFGVPVIVAQALDTAVTTTTDTIIASVTAPSDGSNHVYRAYMWLFVGSGNTNAGSVTAKAHTSSFAPSGLAGDLSFYESTGTPITAISVAQGQSVRCQVSVMEISSGATLELHYQNTAAGTISDKATGMIERLS